MSKSLLEMTPADMADRRKFLKLGGLLLGGVTLTPLIVKFGSIENGNHQTEVPVFGLGEKIDSREKFDVVYQQIAQSFNEQIPQNLAGTTSSEKRDFFWGKDVRALEVVVKQSEYDKHVQEGGFALYMQQQVDMDNRINAATKPPITLKAKLARIIVVADSFTQHPAYRWTDSSYTLASFKVSPDVDHSEFIGDEGDRGEGKYLWKVRDEGGALVVEHDSGKNLFNKSQYRLSNLGTVDSLTGCKGVSIDYYLWHEGQHRWKEITDAYRGNLTDLDRDRFGVRDMKVDDDQWSIPWISPYGSICAQWTANQGRRGYYDHPMGLGTSEQAETDIYTQQPTRFSVKVNGAQSLEVYSTKKQGGYNALYYKTEEARVIDESSRQVAQGDTLQLTTADLNKSAHILKEEKWLKDAVQQPGVREVVIMPTVHVIRAIVNERVVSLNFPIAILNMSRMQGGLDSAKYEITLTGKRLDSTETLRVCYLDSSEVAGRLEEIKAIGGVEVARMKVDGTNVECLWFQEPPVVVEIRESTSPKSYGPLPGLDFKGQLSSPTDN